MGNTSIDCNLGGMRYSLVDSNIRSFQYVIVSLLDDKSLVFGLTGSLHNYLGGTSHKVCNV